MKHTGHKRVRQGYWIVETAKGCRACADLEKGRKKEERKAEKMKLQNAEELNCGKCGKQIGYVYVCDLEGNKFYCTACKMNGEI